MNYKIMPISELKAASYNPRVSLTPEMPEYQRLKRSLEEFDLVQPLVWNDQTGHVVGGHQRLQILKELGHQEVPVVVVSISLDREKALNVALNNDQVAGDWDVDKLQILLDELVTLPEIDETLTGFDDQDFRDLLFTPDQTIKPSSTDHMEESLIKIMIEVEQDQWSQLKPRLDQLIQEQSLNCHISLPEHQ